MKRPLFFIILALHSFESFAQNNDSIWFVNNYIKMERMIPMRDSIKLFTSIYVPKDQSEPHPILLTRTPYSSAPYGENKYSPIWNRYQMAFARENYIFVTQDVRGRYMSEGEFVDIRPFIKNKKAGDIDESTDTYDAIDWLVKNISGNNGNVGVYGISYPGFYSTEAALCNHPALKAVSPQAPVTDWFIGDDFHHNGAFFQMDGFAFYPTFGKPHPKPTMDYGKGFQTKIKDNYEFYLEQGAIKNLDRIIGDSIKFWHELYQHPNYDNWWQIRNARVGLYNVKPALLWVGGLFDAEDCYGAWNTFKATQKQSPATNNKIVMGPWNHGRWASNDGSYLGNIRFGSNTAAWFQQEIMIPFFDYYLKNKGDLKSISKATIFESGSNEWRKYDQWPPKNVTFKELYLDANNKVSFAVNSTAGKLSYDEYTSDPSHPVPYTSDVHERRTIEYLTDDQRFASRRSDVLSYKSPVLSEDITLAGPVIADLMTSISTTDADFIVKLIDVFPDDFEYDKTLKGNNKDYPMGGYQMLVRAEIMRGKFRNSFEKPEPFIPNKKTEVKYELPDVSHSFKKGHRIMIQIQSTWFPLVDRNPQKFINIYTANNSDYQKATIRIYHDSKIILPVLK